MPARIRLKRMGTTKKPQYRVVIADAATPVAGKTIEEIGHYSPRSEPPRLDVNQDRAIHWLMAGATPTETVASLLRKAGVLKRFHELRVSAAKAKKAVPETDATPEQSE